MTYAIVSSSDAEAHCSVYLFEDLHEMYKGYVGLVIKELGFWVDQSPRRRERLEHLKQLPLGTEGEARLALAMASEVIDEFWESHEWTLSIADWVVEGVSSETIQS